MAQGLSVLRLFLLDDRRGGDLDRATLLVDHLAARRSVRGELPEWHVFYETDDISEAMRQCATDLDELDRHWLEIFDFHAVKGRGATGPRLR